MYETAIFGVKWQIFAIHIQYMSLNLKNLLIIDNIFFEYYCQLKFLIPNQPCAMGSVEDEIGDSASKFSKLRPMRVEMFLCVRRANLAVARAFTRTRKNIATDSGETTQLEMILAVLKKVES